MATSDPQLGINSWFEDELREQYQHDRQSVDESWKSVFDRNGAPVANGTPKSNGNVSATPKTAYVPGDGEEAVVLRGAAAAIARNMDASLQIPLATSLRTIPVKVVDENRQLLNHYRTLVGKSKISYTHLIGWAIVRAAREVPSINNAFTDASGEPVRIVRKNINFGLAIDVAGKNGQRSLLVPNIKNAGALTFVQYLAAFDDLVARGRNGKLGMPDFAGTSISLTNPGTVGTMGSVPRLMNGQGAIIAVGSMDYPAELRGMSPEIRAALGVGKVMTITCTYDHRIIQGAESGAFLGKVQSFLDGEEGFYEDIFDELAIPYRPVKWEADRQTGAPAGIASVDVAKQTAVIQLIHAYRVRGHLGADLDPLNGDAAHYHAELDPLNYGLTIWDLDRMFHPGNLGSPNKKQATQLTTLRSILEQLRQTYCGKISCEYMHIQQPDQKAWLQERMEPQQNNWPLAPEQRLQILDGLLNAEEFEHFLHARFVGQKRFSLEGAETAIPILNEILEHAADDGVEEMVMGMAHRGRLTVLANFVGKPLGQIFAEFEGYADPSSMHGSGDVKYHLGACATRKSTTGKEVIVSLSPNPSHLEAVDPVVEGIARTKQDRRGDINRERVLPLLIHGDAAFAGQGVVAETLNLSQLDGYCTGGTIHLIINNQIGFTTTPEKGRSSPYSTDVARMVQAPIFHVNGDDPDAAIRVAQMAYEFRQEFKKDVVIDMVCYRRHGHNEGDDPAYTQPIMYRKIKDHASVAVVYGKKLVKEKVLAADRVEEMRKAAAAHLAKAFEQDHTARDQFAFGIPIEQRDSSIAANGTPISPELAADVVEGATRFPADFHLHPKLKGFVDKRKEALAAGGPIDWAFAEALAFGSLVVEGNPVRLSGQDSGRGTFSQRHLAFYDFENGNKYIPLQHLSPRQARFNVYDSSLSEYAVLGFEFGYTVADPETLVLWEAQFGDFANGAQIMIDQFIATAEEKWSQPNGIVMLLPHGQEGQGPEHSSARMERFLELCARDNMQICNCTTPAQYFHVLRRQMRGGADGRGTRKPLIIFTPKSILRHPKAVSTFGEITGGGFEEVLYEAPNKDVKRIVFCSGKVYYDLVAARDTRALSQIAIARMEQVYPFASEKVKNMLAGYADDVELVWLQEEPRNMGAWRFIEEDFACLGRKIRYVGRAANSSPATGSKKRHDAEQADIVTRSLEL